MNTNENQFSFSRDSVEATFLSLVIVLSILTGCATSSPRQSQWNHVKKGMTVEQATATMTGIPITRKTVDPGGTGEIEWRLENETIKWNGIDWNCNLHRAAAFVDGRLVKKILLPTSGGPPTAGGFTDGSGSFR